MYIQKQRPMSKDTEKCRLKGRDREVETKRQNERGRGSERQRQREVERSNIRVSGRVAELYALQVAFFGEESFGEVAARSVKPFAEGVAKKYNQKGQGARGFSNAVDQAVNKTHTSSRGHESENSY